MQTTPRITLFDRMKTARTTRVLLFAVLAAGLLGWLANESATAPKARAQRINTKHNLVTKPISAPASVNAPPAVTPPAHGQR